jgi:F0F1-type ATP synthase assembly protein I
MSTSISDISEISLVYWLTELGAELCQGYLASSIRRNPDREFAGYFSAGLSFDVSESNRVYRASLTSLNRIRLVTPRVPGLFLTTPISVNLNSIMAAPNKRLYPRSQDKKPGGIKYPIVSRKAGVLVAMALELPGSIIGGLFIGYLLDNYFDTSPWIMMALTTLGFTAACIRLVRWARYFSEERSKTESANRERSADRSAASLKE